MTADSVPTNWPRGSSAHGPRTKKQMKRKQKKDADAKLTDNLGMFAGYGKRKRKTQDD